LAILSEGVLKSTFLLHNLDIFFKGYGNCEFKRQFLDLLIFLGGGNIPLLYPLVIPDFGSNG
jgi:hypothetical protein